MCACCVGSSLVWSIFERKETSRQKQNRMSCLITQNNELPLCTTTHCRSNHGIVRKSCRILTELMQCMILSDYSNMRVWGSFFWGEAFFWCNHAGQTRECLKNGIALLLSQLLVNWIGHVARHPACALNSNKLLSYSFLGKRLKRFSVPRIV